MGQDNYKFRYEAYKNNTFDLDVVEKSLIESKMSGYQYLREFQLISTGYKRFDFDMQEIYRTPNINHVISLVPRRWVFFIEHEFINVGKRLAFKRSEFYEKDISYDDIIKRPDLFDSTFLVFINGKLYTKGVKVLCKEDKTYIIFLCRETPSPEGFSMAEMKDFIENNARVSIYFIPNVGIKTISTNAYRVRTQNSRVGIPVRTLGLTDYVDYNNSLTYIRPSGEIASIPSSSNIVDNGLYIDEMAINEIISFYPNNTSIDIQLIPLRNLLGQIEIEKGNKWFEIPMQDYPVAIENCLVMDENGLFVHDAKIEHYYPNIYSIENVDDIIANKKLFIYVFYFESKVDKLKHLDMLAAYHKYVPDYLEKYKDGTVPNIVKNFVPQIVDYSIKDYRAGLACNESVTEVYIKNSDDKIHKITIKNMNLITEPYDGDDKNDSPRYFKVRDMKSMQMYKIGMENGLLYTEPINVRTDDKDIVYVYDDIAQSHTHLSTESNVLSLFEWIHYSDHFKYKIIKMREFIRADANNFRRYLRNLGLGNNYYYVDVSKIDLSQRIRRDNIDTKLDYRSFNKDMYMFVFRNDFRGMYDELIIHIDGIRYDREVQVYKANMLDYVYIPCELIKPDTVLEIEKVTDVNKDIHFRSHSKANIVKLDISEFAVRNKTLFNDLFVVDKLTGEYLDPSAYQVILPVKFHMDDMESDIVLDYIITESDAGYYQLAILDKGLIEIYVDEDAEDPENAFFLSLQSDDHNFYQFDLDNKVAKFNKVDAINGFLTNKVRSMNDKNLIYQFKMIDGAIKIEISEDDGTGKQLAEGGLNIFELDEVFLPCPRELKIKILDKEYLNRDLVLHIKKNHNIQYLENDVLDVDAADIEMFRPIPFKTISKRDPRYFRVYQNGKLIPRHLGIVNFPEYEITGDGELYPGFLREPGVDYNIAIECMPYMMKQVCYLKNIPGDKVVNLKGLIDKPFDFKWYDIYINGRKLVKKDVEIISANLIRILKTDSLKNLEIIENSRDKEYFGGFENGIYDILDDIYEQDKDFSDNLNDAVANDGNVNDTEEGVINTPVSPLDFIIRVFHDFLINSFGFINPDELQLTRENVKQFSLLLDENEPFKLAFDEMGANRLDEERFAMNINPDE